MELLTQFLNNDLAQVDRERNFSGDVQTWEIQQIWKIHDDTSQSLVVN